MGGLNYKVVKKTFGFDKDGTEKYVAEAVRGGTVSFEKVIEQISLRSGISKATCRAVVETMVESACTWMLEGHGVSLGNMGYLKPAITCKSSEVSGEEKIIRKRVLFQPARISRHRLTRCRSTGCMKKETAHREQPSRVRKERTREEEVSINHFLIHF